MATTVEPTTRERASAAAATTTPWYRDRNQQLAVGLRDFLATKPEAKYTAPASGLLGAALENAQKWSDAGDAFSNASMAADLPYLKARYLVDAGRAYREAGKPQQAIAVYREIIAKYPKTTSMTEAQVRLAELTDGKM